MPDASQSTDSNAESNSHEVFAPPYASTCCFSDTSWQLRKNLTEIFDRHVFEKKAKNFELKGECPPKSHTSSVSGKITHLEQKFTTTASIVATGRPLRQPSSSHHPCATRSQDKRCVSVYLRIRPPETGTANTIEIIPNEPPTKVRTHAPAISNAAKANRERRSTHLQDQSRENLTREFDFDEVFGPEQQNEHVYTKVVAPMVAQMFSPATLARNDFKEPQPGLVFAYGATNAGKTYSILGKAPMKRGDAKTEDQMHLGIVPRAISDLIQQARRDGQRFDLYMSYYEIHNENIYDLLGEKSYRNPIMALEPLKLRESQNKNIIIRGLRKRRIIDLENGLKLAREAQAKRQTSSNSLNNDSSRSHFICELIVVRRESDVRRVPGSAALNGHNTEEEAVQNSLQRSTSLWIVDLAGSERNKRTDVCPARQKEASSINKSLSNLMRCLSILRENQSTACSGQIIPFRESKLTHLLMPIFTRRGASIITMIVHVNPTVSEFDETNHVLSNASRAKMIQIEDKDDARVRHGACEYGYSGRLVLKSIAASKFVRMVKKLSPQKFMKRDNISKCEEGGIESDLSRKRKAAPIAITTVASFSSTASNWRPIQPVAKKMRVVQPGTKSAFFPKSNIQSLKVALSIAHNEIEILKALNAKLTDELAQVEATIRLEVSEEMEEQLESTKRHYANIINTMGVQSRQSLGVFEKKAREGKTAEQVEVLVFKVNHCEEEMIRMKQEHKRQIFALQEGKAEDRKARENQIKQLKAQNRDKRCIGDTENIVQAQLQIFKQDQELEQLKKSKTDLIAAYEKLLSGKEEDKVE